MIIYVLVSLTNILAGTRLGSPSNVEQYQGYDWFFHGIGYLFMFCFVNVIVCGVSGVILLLTKDRRKLGAFCLVASFTFVLTAKQIGDAF